jgi:hypothetical protein
MGADTRLKLGIALLVLGLVMPAGTFLVAATDWPTSVKGAVNAFLFFGFEIMMVPAVALMGKENFDRIVDKTKGVLRSLKPSGGVSRGRYRLGLVLFVGPLLYAWIAAYVPTIQPEGEDARLWLNLVLDLTLVVSLFVLGGDFWDKLRALFVHEARATFPNEVSSKLKPETNEGLRDCSP